MIDSLVESKDTDYGIDGETRALLLKVSPAAADRLLKKARKADEIRGISTTRAARSSLRSQVPVRTHYDRKTVKPGHFAFDTVAHCGGSASGQYCKTLTGTDVSSGWVEERPLLNAANRRVQEAFADTGAGLPFPLKGAHFDNGTGFINKPLPDRCLKRSIEPTRSRPYRKNGNCFAEQKNFDAVRKNVGYFRFDTPGEPAALAEVYLYLCPLYNYRYRSFRLVDKVRQADGRYKKVYGKEPKTPCRRLLDSPDISDECKTELRRRKAAYNPSELNTRLNAAVDSLLRINREKGQNKQSPCQGDARPETARNKAGFWVSAPFSARFFLRQCGGLRNFMCRRYNEAWNLTSSSINPPSNTASAKAISVTRCCTRSMSSCSKAIKTNGCLSGMIGPETCLK